MIILSTNNSIGANFEHESSKYQYIIRLLYAYHFFSLLMILFLMIKLYYNKFYLII